MAQAATLDEIKDRIRKRVGRRSPFHLMDAAEAEGVLTELKGLEADHWAEVWSKPGARWEKTAKDAEDKGKTEEARDAYFQAAGYYGSARHPFPSSPGKQEAYRKTIENYLAAARYFDPPLERVALPLRDKEVVGYLRLPAKRPAAVIMHWGGIDNWKEDRHSFVESILAEGWGCFIMDSPGTGESPVLASDTAHEVYSVALDYLVNRPEVDSTRIAALGGSFGGYWSTKLAHVEPERLRPRSTGAAASTASSSPSGSNAPATPRPTSSTSSRPAPTCSARRPSRNSARSCPSSPSRTRACSTSPAPPCCS